MFYVYCYKNPQTKLPFYIGKGGRNRAWVHLNPKNRRNCHFHNTITKIEQELGIPPIVEIIQDDLTEDAAYALEIKLIKKFGRIYYDANGILTNVDEGGNGPTLKSRTKISDSLSGRSFEQTHCQNLSEARKRQTIPPKARLWVIKSPQGELYEVINLKKFCAEHDLNYDGLKHNVKSEKPVRSGQSAGWKAVSAIPYKLSAQLSTS